MSKSAQHVTVGELVTSTSTDAENTVSPNTDNEEADATTATEKPKTKKPGRPPKAGIPTASEAPAIEQPQITEVRMPISRLEYAFNDIRDKCDPKTVERYKASGKDKLPPIKIAYCPGNPAIHGKILDGMHRLKALEALGETNTLCRYVAVTNETDARIKAFDANLEHGKHYSFHEKARDAYRRHQMGFSQTSIAEHLHISQATVSRMIRDIHAEETGVVIQKTKKYSDPKQCAKILQKMVNELGESGIAQEIITQMEALYTVIEAAAVEADVADAGGTNNQPAEPRPADTTTEITRADGDTDSQVQNAEEDETLTDDQYGSTEHARDDLTNDVTLPASDQSINTEVTRPDSDTISG